MKFQNIFMLLGILELTYAQSFPKCPNPSNGSSLTNATCIMSEPTRLYQNESITNGNCTLTMKLDGNLILQQSGEAMPAWETGPKDDQVTHSDQGFFAACQSDGNLVVYLYQSGVPENQNIAVYASNSAQPNWRDKTAELWMSDGSEGYCTLNMVWDESVIWTVGGSSQPPPISPTTPAFPKCPNPSNGSSLTNAACIMAEGTRLGENKQITNGNCTLTMNADGNLHLWRSGEPRPSWFTGTIGYQDIHPAYFATFQSDGNLVVYLNQEGFPGSPTVPVYATNTVQSEWEDKTFELWMSDGSEGFCALYILWDESEIWNAGGSLTSPLCPHPHFTESYPATSLADRNTACIMAGGSRLYQGASVHNNHCTLTMQLDGNLVLRRSGKDRPSWDTGSAGYQVTHTNQGFFTELQPDSNLVVYLYEEGVPENENILVFATNTSQSDIQDKTTELWMSDGSEGFCILYILTGEDHSSFLVWRTVSKSTRFNSLGHRGRYLYESELLLEVIASNSALVLQHDCNLVQYYNNPTNLIIDLADLDIANIKWSAGYTYQGNDKKCVFTIESDGTFSIYLISENNQWEKVWNLTNRLGAFEPECSSWGIYLFWSPPVADCCDSISCTGYDL